MAKLISYKSLLYKGEVLKQLYFGCKLSCAELSDRINRSRPLTTKVLNDLIKEGYVIETGFAPSTGGRRSLIYSVKPDMMYMVSVAMDQFVTRIAILDMENNPINGIEKFELPLHGNAAALSLLTKKIEQVIDSCGIAKEKIAGVGIGMPGFVDTGKGINYSFLEIKGVPVTEYIKSKVGLPVFIDNDSSLVALAELKFGKARNKKNAMVINIGWGIGLGLIINGQLFRGSNGFAGEFSHIPLFSNGKLCECGKSGCLQTESSLLVVIQKAREGLKAGRLSTLKNLPIDQFELSYEAITEAVSKGDQFVIELLSEAGYQIGRGVAILIHLLNPEVIILSGRGAALGNIWQPPIQQALNEHCIPRLAINTKIEESALGYKAEIIGAAALVMDNYENLSWKKIFKKDEQLFQ